MRSISALLDAANALEALATGAPPGAPAGPGGGGPDPSWRRESTNPFWGWVGEWAAREWGFVGYYSGGDQLLSVDWAR